MALKVGTIWSEIDGTEMV